RRCGQENLQLLWCDAGKEYVWQESDGRGTDNVHHWAGWGDQAHIPQGQTRGACGGGAGVFERGGARRGVVARAKTPVPPNIRLELLLQLDSTRGVLAAIDL